MTAPDHDDDAGASGPAEPDPDLGTHAEAPARRVATGSLSVATWTVVSRFTGLVRLAVIAAVLGPTFLGNTFQAVNQLPNLTYSALTGSVFTMLLVPPLVRRLDARDIEAQERIAGGFLGLVLVVFTGVVAVAILAGPLVFRLFVIGVSDPRVAAAQRRAGWLLFAMVMPQAILYAVAGIGEAVQNAHGRFALAAAAPAFENVGVALVMGVVALRYGSGTDLLKVGDPELLVLGLGSTLAVVAHAGAQWWGARRAGVRLTPRAGWRDPEVRELARRAVASLGYAGLNALRFVVMLVVANRVPGGVVAFQFALNLLFFPVAITAWPVSVAVMAELSRLYVADAAQRFRDELLKGAKLVLFFAIPASVAALVLAGPVARAVAFGEMANTRGFDLLTASIAALAIGVVGDSVWMVCTFGAYARNDAAGPFRSMALRTGVTAAGLVAAFVATQGTSLLVAMGVAVTAGTFVGAAHLVVTVARRLPRSGEPVLRPLARNLVASLVMVGPAYGVTVAFHRLASSRGRDVLGVAVATIVGGAVYVGLQRLWHSPELHEWTRGVAEIGPWGRS
jgi:putative peptidoglycan lipid II flippase